tara:strand:+ start:309 stop:620 length:312 start_codon:yes stop_codon:yes gene_type:complete
VNVPDVDVLTAPKSKTITAAFVLVVAEVFELYITAACAEIDALVKLISLKSIKDVLFVAAAPVLVKLPPPAAYVPDALTSCEVVYAVVVLLNEAELPYRASLN